MDSEEEIQKRFLQQMIDEEKKELTENVDLINSFKQICAKKGINLKNENFRYIQSIGIVACFPKIVYYLNPKVVLDKEGLIDFKYLNKKFQQRHFVTGYLYDDDFMLMAHPYFRRGLNQNANFAPRFIDLFWSLKDSKIDTYISIDYDRVRINVDGRTCLEEDTWFGAQFNNNIDEIDDGIVKLRPPSDIDPSIIDLLFSNSYSLDIKWETKKNGIKTFQSEEFKTEKSTINKNGIEYYPARYIHAEFDTLKKHFRHFDGAIHFYTEDEYYTRRDSDFNYNFKNKVHIKTNSEKLFKMNGEVNVNTWIEFTCHFMTGNPLINEYFEGKYPTHISDILDAIRKSKNIKKN